MTCVVTGSSGRLGGAIVSLLRKRGLACTGTDLAPGEFTDLLADIRQPQALRSLVRGADTIIHTAALHGRQMDEGRAPEDFVSTNVTGTLNLLSLARESGVRRFIYTSSTSIYGEAMVQPDRAVWVDENLPVQPRDIYDITKQAAEQLCRIWFARDSLQTCALRVSRFMDEPLNDIANYRLYRGLDERDGARAHLLAAQHDHGQFEVYNISNRSPFTPDDLVELKTDPAAVIRRNFDGVDAMYEQLGWRLPGSIDRVYSTGKAEQALGYRPRHNFIEYMHDALQGMVQETPRGRMA